MGFTSAQRQSMLDAYLTGTLYIGFSTTTPTHTGSNFTEPPTDYARLVSAEADWGSADANDPTSATNVNAITGTAVAGTWASGVNVTYWGVFNAATAGNLTAYGPVTTPKPVLIGDVPSLPVGTAVFNFDDSDAA